ncbi:unnamed protein product [Ilex paraguariensis]|uniref:Uncharacterized protein n=1 Tax=Ilex paraguariensis TaxID=185542 RepID=A0ABC8UCC2_9AQUA
MRYKLKKLKSKEVQNVIRPNSSKKTTKSSSNKLDRLVQDQSRNRKSERETMAKSLGPTGEFFRRRDEWRKHPMLTNQLRHATPGLGIAVVAFGIYLVGEAAYNKIYAPSHSHHSSSSSILVELIVVWCIIHGLM